MISIFINYVLKNVYNENHVCKIQKFKFTAV